MTREIYHLAPNGGSESSAAWRILRAQRLIKMNSRKLTFKNPGTNGDYPYSSSKFSTLAYFITSKCNSALIRIFYKNSQSLPWSLDLVTPPKFSKKIVNKATLLNIHWIPSTYKNFNDKNKSCPVVITSHDVWNLTGGCHCNLGCEEWKHGCQKCPQITARFPRLQSPAKSFVRKAELFQSIEKLGVVAPSNWIAEMYAQSSMFKNRRIAVIPNPGNTSIFYPTSNFKHLLNIETSERIYRLLYVVSGNIDAYHKGFDLLLEILMRSSRLTRRKFEVIVVGEKKDPHFSLENLPMKFYGNVTSQEEMSALYNESNLVISTSRQDNLPNTLIESILCGTPVISFNIGGISDIVQNYSNGLLIDPFDVESFAEALNTLIDEKSITLDSRKQIASKAHREYSEESIANLYREFYELMEAGEW